MRIIFGLVVVIAFCLGVVNAGPLASQPQVVVIQVKSGDTVWKIAAEHSSPRQDVRDVIASIRYLNQLDGNGQIYPGQMLKVPQPAK